MKKLKLWLACLSVCIVAGGCSSKQKPQLKVVATAVPHAQMLEYIKPDLKNEGIDLKIIVTDDYNMPNRALADREVDANFFQHIPFMQEQISQFHYAIESLAKIELEPMGIYSDKIKSLSELRPKAVIAIPSDPTNESRALLLLQAHGVIQLNRGSKTSNATIANIVKNPKGIKFVEVDAAMIARSIQDVDAVAMNTNYALQANFSPLEDAIVLEGKNSPYVNIIAIRKGDDYRPDIQALRAAMTSEKMKQFILDKYKGAIIPAF